MARKVLGLICLRLQQQQASWSGGEATHQNTASFDLLFKNFQCRPPSDRGTAARAKLLKEPDGIMGYGITVPDPAYLYIVQCSHPLITAIPPRTKLRWRKRSTSAILISEWHEMGVQLRIIPRSAQAPSCRKAPAGR